MKSLSKDMRQELTTSLDKLDSVLWDDIIKVSLDDEYELDDRILCSQLLWQLYENKSRQITREARRYKERYDRLLAIDNEIKTKTKVTNDLVDLFKHLSDKEAKAFEIRLRNVKK